MNPDHRERILQTVRDMITELGYNGLSMRALARRANVALQTLYNLYNNKDGLVLEAITTFLEEGINKAADIVAEPGWERIIEVAEQQALQIEQVPRYAEAVTIALLQSEAGDVLPDLLLGDVAKRYKESLLAMKRKKQLRPGLDVDYMAMLLAGIGWSSIFVWQKGYLRLEELRQAMLDEQIAMLMSITQGEAHDELNKHFTRSIRSRSRRLGR